MVVVIDVISNNAELKLPFNIEGVMEYTLRSRVFFVAFYLNISIAFVFLRSVLRISLCFKVVNLNDVKT